MATIDERREITTDEDAELVEIMSNISEDCYYAGWLEGLEYSLWGLVEGDYANFGVCHDLSNDWRVHRLRELREQTGRWGVWADNDRRQTTVSADEFRAEYEGRRAAFESEEIE